MDNQTVSYEQAKDYLNQLYDWSLNGHSCWNDFIALAHNNFTYTIVDFSNYGYLEFTLFGNALTIFNNWGYDELTKMIEEVLAENNELAETE